MRITCLIFLTAFPLTVTADDYLMVFSADGIPYRPTTAHTFAAVVRVECRAGATPHVVELQSLSWLPATGKVRGLALRSEKGRNVPLDETLRDAQATGRTICLWGPYRIQSEVADQFRGRIVTVESSFAYKGASFFSPLHVCDCARSVEELLGSRRYIGVFGYGAAAASVIVQKYSSSLILPEQAHPEVATLCGLDDYTLTRRSYGDFTSRGNQWKASLRLR